MHRQIRYFAALLICTLGLSATGCDWISDDGSPADDDVSDLRILPDDASPRSDLPADAATIEAVRIEGDVITLSVAYSGGCETHDFQLYASRFFMESLPVQSAVFLAHDANGDQCEALIREEVSFDLSPLKEVYRQSYSDDDERIRLRLQAPTGEDDPRFREASEFPLYTF